MTAVRVAIAGSSGSIGTQTLDVVRAEARAAYEVVALGVGSSVDVLVQQALEFRPKVVAVADPAKRAAVAAALPFAEVVADFADLVEPADVVVNAVVGFAGLAVTVRTLRPGKRLALANKESLIAAGPVVQPLRATPGAELVPVDSEHCAVHQCLRSSAFADREVSRIVLTASGGPFRGRTAAELADVGVDEALAHPTWKMGPKITIDSSTLMNKGLEVIEAHELFGTAVRPHRGRRAPAERRALDGRVHRRQHHRPAVACPTCACPSATRSRTRRASARRSAASTGPSLGRLDFEAPDTATFRCLALAYDAGRAGSTAPAWLSAANEVAVDAFLQGRLRWSQIAEVCDAALQRYEPGADSTVDDIIAADARAREVAKEVLPVMSNETRFDRLTNEVVSGGTQREPDGQPSAATTVGRRARMGRPVRRAVGRQPVVRRVRRRPRCLHRAPRVRPLLDRPPQRHEGHAVLPRLRPADLEHPPRRRGVRRAGHPARRLREDHRHDQRRRGGARGRAVHLPSGARTRVACGSSPPVR